MALLPILEFPDPRLRTKAVDVTAEQLAEPSFQQLFDDMFETMYEAPGIGLAASQVDVHKRFMVIDVTEDKTRPLVFVNPVISARQGEQVYQEGCLSVPGIYADVTRANSVRVEALNRHGESCVIESDGLLAVCIQHELDHLAGKVFVDYLSPLKRDMVRKKLAKQAREKRGASDREHSLWCASFLPVRRSSRCPASTPCSPALSKWSPSTPSRTARPGAVAH